MSWILKYKVVVFFFNLFIFFINKASEEIKTNNYSATYCVSQYALYSPVSLFVSHCVNT